MVASCAIQEEDFKTPQQDNVVYYASFEQPALDGTRVYANEDLLLRWTADDRVSIFGKNTYNQQYKFLGETGDNSGGFGKVDVAEYVTGNPISHTVSVYPYQASTKITEDEVLTVTLPAEQHYAGNTFGLGANTMVSVSEDNVLQYKNVGGYLMLKLYGDGVTVSSITLKGNNGEKLAGKATVTMPLDGAPTAVMAEDASDEITLVCETPVTLGATAEESTQFWFVVPVVTFNKGFTVTVSDDGGVFEKSTDKTLTIDRNSLSKMSPIEVDISQPKSAIHYTSSDGSVVTPYNTNVFGASIVSNEYVDGQGIISFDGPVTSIGERAFIECSSLTSITIPDSVTSIGKLAFSDCSSLTSITIPDSVTSIGDEAFQFCSSLTSITIPDGVTSISVGVFFGCSSLTSITIPDNVTSIGNWAFSECTNLNNITIPGSVTSIGGSAFSDCSSLTSITIPDSVTSIGESAFSGCSSLTSITIPDSVTSISFGVFSGCSSLKSVTIPGSVTSIGEYAFGGCSSINSITIPDSVTSIGEGAFNYCTSLTSITIPDILTSIEDRTFSGCSSLTDITIPDSVTSIGKYAFNYCTSLTSITIPGSVTSIGEIAFQGCTSLTSITVLPETPPKGGTFMFYATNNAPIYVPARSVEAYKTARYWSTYADRIYAIGTPVAVDLGLPSGLKWASFNLGASKPEEYGDYYAWGETEPYYSSLNPLTWKEGKEAGYDWPSYKWCMGSENTLTKYCGESSLGYNGFTDDKTILDPEDDAAHVSLGGNWRMPTEEEWWELRQNCTWTKATRNGVEGELVTADNGNSIFLPAAGSCNRTSLNYAGAAGSYWSSSLVSSESAHGVDFYSGGLVTGVPYFRCHGGSVRPVSE